MSIVLHWVMLGIIFTAYGAVMLLELFERGTVPRDALKSVHISAGLAVLFLVCVRAGAWLAFSAPPITPEPTATQRRAASIMHFALYAFMVLVPLTGWLFMTAAGKPVVFFGIELPALFGEAKAFAKPIKEAHEAGGNLGYLLIAGHACAALYHHYVRRDNTLTRML